MVVKLHITHVLNFKELCKELCHQSGKRNENWERDASLAAKITAKQLSNAARPLGELGS